jgi:hypothetical protein
MTTAMSPIDGAGALGDRATRTGWSGTVISSGKAKENVMLAPLGVFEIVIPLVIIAVVVIPIRRILIRIGFPGWLGFFVVIPIVNLCLLYYLAYSEWPDE